MDLSGRTCPVPHGTVQVQTSVSTLAGKKTVNEVGELRHKRG